jgi:hypothetical protein
MKRFLQVSIILLASFSQAQAEDFWRDSVRACVVGGGVIGTASALMLYSAATTAVSGAAIALPAGPVVVGNTIFGCGLGTIGTMLMYGLGNLYQNMVFSSRNFSHISQSQPTVNPDVSIPTETIEATAPVTDQK